MISQFVLYVASSSPSRHQLLRDAAIPFQVIPQDADESLIPRNQSLEDAVRKTALLKMQHAQMPQGCQGELAFVLTADTMGTDHQGTICGKPETHAQAHQMINRFRHGAVTGTAICVERRRYIQGVWVVEEQRVAYVAASYAFDMPDNWIDYYIANCRQIHGIDVLQVSGGVAIEGFGAQFVRDLVGSYTTITGLPMFELRTILSDLGFYSL